MIFTFHNLEPEGGQQQEGSCSSHTCLPQTSQGCRVLWEWFGHHIHGGGGGGSNLKKSCGSGSVVMELVNLTDNNASGYRPRGVECSSYGHTQLGVLTTGI